MNHRLKRAWNVRIGLRRHKLRKADISWTRTGMRWSIVVTMEWVKIGLGGDWNGLVGLIWVEYWTKKTGMDCRWGVVITTCTGGSCGVFDWFYRRLGWTRVNLITMRYVVLWHVMFCLQLRYRCCLSDTGLQHRRSGKDSVMLNGWNCLGKIYKDIS